jgi:hypothetical protein
MPGLSLKRKGPRMPRKTTNTVSHANKRLLEAHQVVSHLQDAIKGRRALNKVEREALIDHVIGCAFCMHDVEKIRADLENSISTTAENDPLYELLGQLSVVSRKLVERDEAIAAYVEALELGGPEQAERKFPDFAMHLRGCKVCQAEVQSLQAMVKQAKQDGLIATDKGKHRSKG